ncbi:FAD-dependent oxidoreductase [Siphonobacter sp. SORGH_AS_0500]|uniref:NAD(P)/FAD-dependent oxidoreductase n=1 Tax=Siphonobacter sp. SORGH_AS_0500 TaxID=1864824 RepID=UPI002858EDCC|nr:FAD-dependent oxidoreductase [Siphonobacter sp. SORGH_AS_0500]MDR6197192.1 flavin-dependent dehydrogenase [Siphonobacter sp. SORGH_AS_0500]
MRSDILIVGGGLAGLTAGIHLAQLGFEVTLLEKQVFPNHKVCGEYISNEVRPYLDSLGVGIDTFQPSEISEFLLTTPAGQPLQTSLPLGGFGLSRFTLDQALADQARKSGVRIIQDQVTSWQLVNDRFEVTTLQDKAYEAPLLIAAYGKRSALDKQLPKSPWMAIKGHYQLDFPSNLIALNTFSGGYCGISKVEKERVNACYLVQTEVFKPYRTPEEFQQQVMSKNPFLKDFFARAQPLFEKSLTISQISFAAKPAVENHVLRCGDTAGLIHPLCGNGMAMAIHSARLAVEAITSYRQHGNRSQLESQYSKAWHRKFNSRLRAGRLVQHVLQQPRLTAALARLAPNVPGLVSFIIRQTHGELIPPAYVHQYS